MSQAPGISSGLWNFVDIIKIRKFVKFWTILGLILGPFWDSSWAHFGSILGTEMGPLRGGQMSGNTRNSKVFCSGLAPSGVPFWATFGIHFGLILGPILDPFWDKFGSNYGLVLGAIWESTNLISSILFRILIN